VRGALVRIFLRNVKGSPILSENNRQAVSWERRFCDTVVPSIGKAPRQRGREEKGEKKKEREMKTAGEREKIGSVRKKRP